MGTTTRAGAEPGTRQVETTLEWRYRGQRGPITSTVWTTWRDSRLVGLDETRSDQLPLWWLEPVTVSTVTGLPIAVAVGTDGWPRRLEIAQEQVAAAVSGARIALPATTRIEVASSTTTADRAAGGALGGSAALTWPDRILISAARAGGAAESQLVLSHELVHLQTGSAGSPAPRWVVEGFADRIALRAQPDLMRRLITTQGAGLEVPTRLPERPATSADYLVSMLAWSAVEQRLGHRAAIACYVRLRTDPELSGCDLDPDQVLAGVADQVLDLRAGRIPDGLLP